MDMNKEIKKLESAYLQKPQRVFSMYLNTDPADPDQQGGEWRIHLKNGLNSFENYLEKDDNDEEKRNFKKVKDKVKRFIHDNELNLKKSIVIFASPDDSIWFAEIFQIPVESHFYWEETAKTDQLKALYNKFPKTGIILTQKEAIKTLDTELCTLKDTQIFALDLETEDWRQHTGPHRAQITVGSGGKSAKQEQFESRFEANRHRWYKGLASKLDKLAKDNQWQHIYIVGDKEEAKDLCENMNKEVTNIIEKNMLEHKEVKVIEEVMAS